ncbi:MAG: hypothetical protein ABIL09_24040, partial [Gemmatimonadota bacterium]
VGVHLVRGPGLAGAGGDTVRQVDVLTTCPRCRCRVRAYLGRDGRWRLLVHDHPSDRRYEPGKKKAQPVVCPGSGLLNRAPPEAT